MATITAPAAPATPAADLIKADAAEISSRIAGVRLIGSAVSKTSEDRDAILAIIDATPGFKADKHGAIPALIHVWATGGDLDKRPQVATGPAGAQTKTNYGRGVDALTKSVKAALAKRERDAAKAAAKQDDQTGETPTGTDETPTGTEREITKVERLAFITSAVRLAIEAGATADEVMAAVRESM